MATPRDLWPGWHAPCQNCQQLITIGEGIFCTNFSANHGPWSPCLWAWHRKCYCTTDNGEFPIAKPQDEEGEFMVQDVEEERHFCKARDGDNLVTPFQCDICHFINLTGLKPIENLALDVCLLKCIWRVNLDAFWSWESGTVKNVVNEVWRGLAIASQFSFAHSLFQSRGPFPVIDLWASG